MQSLQQYLRVAASRGRTATRVGPFLVTVQETTDHPYLNYAIPDDGAEPTAQHVAALVAAMRDRHRVPRLEYLERTAPAALPVLEAAGFRVELRPLAMTATAAADVAVPAGYALAVPESDADLAGMLAAQSAAFGEPGEATPEHLARSRDMQAAGGIALAVREEAGGTIVGGGLATPPAGSGFTEVAGIAIAEGHRRRGLATALAAELTRRALAAGVRTAFLTPGDDGAARVYERAGYAGEGHMLHVRQ